MYALQRKLKTTERRRRRSIPSCLVKTVKFKLFCKYSMRSAWLGFLSVCLHESFTPSICTCIDFLLFENLRSLKIDQKPFSQHHCAARRCFRRSSGERRYTTHTSETIEQIRLRFSVTVSILFLLISIRCVSADSFDRTIEVKRNESFQTSCHETSLIWLFFIKPILIHI